MNITAELSSKMRDKFIQLKIAQYKLEHQWKADLPKMCAQFGVDKGRVLNLLAYWRAKAMRQSAQARRNPRTRDKLAAKMVGKRLESFTKRWQLVVDTAEFDANFTAFQVH